MATFTPKKLAFVQLSDTPATTVYDSGAAIGEVHNIILHNANTTTEVVILNLYDGTNTYQLFKVSLVTLETMIIEFINEGLIVDASSLINGSTTTAAKVTCSINGTERT